MPKKSRTFALEKQKTGNTLIYKIRKNIYKNLFRNGTKLYQRTLEQRNQRK